MSKQPPLRFMHVDRSRCLLVMVLLLPVPVMAIMNLMRPDGRLAHSFLPWDTLFGLVLLLGWLVAVGRAFRNTTLDLSTQMVTYNPFGVSGVWSTRRSLAEFDAVRVMPHLVPILRRFGPQQHLEQWKVSLTGVHGTFDVKSGIREREEAERDRIGIARSLGPPFAPEQTR